MKNPKSRYSERDDWHFMDDHCLTPEYLHTTGVARNSIDEAQTKFEKQVSDKKHVRLQYTSEITVADWSNRALAFIRGLAMQNIAKMIIQFITNSRKCEEMAKSGRNYKLLDGMGFDRYEKVMVLYLVKTGRGLLEVIYRNFKIDDVVEDIMSTDIGKEILHKVNKQLGIVDSLEYERVPWSIDHKLLIVNMYVEETEKKGQSGYAINNKNKRRLLPSGTTAGANRGGNNDAGRIHVSPMSYRSDDENFTMNFDDDDDEDDYSDMSSGDGPFDYASPILGMAMNLVNAVSRQNLGGGGSSDDEW